MRNKQLRKFRLWMGGVFFFLSASYLLGAVSFKEAIMQLGPGKNGLDSGLQMVELWHNMTANLKYDRKTEKFFHFISEALQQFDFGQIYNSPYFSGRRDRYHTVTFEGIHAPTAYHLKLTRKAFDSIPLNRLGNAGIEYGLRKNEHKDSDRTYSFSFRLRSAMKQFNNENGARYLDGLLKILDPKNLSELKANRSRIYPELKGVSRQLADELHRSFPSFSYYLNRYTKLESFVSVKEQQGKKYTAFKLVGKLRENNLEKDYPEFADFIDDIRKLFRVKIYLKDPHGHHLSYISLDAFAENFVWTFNTAGGKVLPSDKKRNPVFSEGFTMSGVKKYDFYAFTNAFMNISGLKIHLGQSTAYGVYKKTPTDGTFRFKILKIKKGKVSGAFYHVIPTWLIDIAIPGNLEGLMNKFSQVMEKAHNGKGTRFSLGWNHRNPRESFLNARAGTEFLDNRFVRFGLKIWVRRFRPDEEKQEEMRQLFGKLMGALMKDLQKMKSG